MHYFPCILASPVTNDLPPRINRSRALYPPPKKSLPFPPGELRKLLLRETILFFQWKDKRFGLDGIFTHSNNKIGSRCLWNYSPRDYFLDDWVSIVNWKFIFRWKNREKRIIAVSLEIIFLLLANDLWLMTWFLSYW